MFEKNWKKLKDYQDAVNLFIETSYFSKQTQFFDEYRIKISPHNWQDAHSKKFKTGWVSRKHAARINHARINNYF